MLKWFPRFGGGANERDIKRIEPLVQEINALDEEYAAMSAEELAGVTPELKQRLADGVSLDDILPDAFAAVREAARRTIGLRHYDVQLIGGVVLHQGKIAEMRTGEGKTLVATLPAYLNSLTGLGVHIVTVNDYLARRDPQWMGPIYHMLGVSVASIQHDVAFMYDPEFAGDDVSHAHLRPISRREAYEANITYGTNNEFGFDYLRDNMVMDLGGRVQRELNYAIVDEVDNILIDEARTPLIISGTAEESAEQYLRFAQVAPRLTAGADYEIDEKHRNVTLTEIGLAKVERMIGVDNLYDPANFELTHYLDNALKAQVLYHRDHHYTVRDGEVIIVDDHTGRMMPGRRWSDGLHQAVEAKERVRVKEETITLATITFQNYFRIYEKLSGMTGTAATERDEFDKIYRLEVMTVPTHRPMIREDLPDLIYKTEEAKFRAVIEEIKMMNALGRPVLVGTVSIEKSEVLSEMLLRQGIKHEVLNAKLHEREATVVAQAGQPGAVTVSTNMAGRGTDIILGGNVEGMAREILRKRGVEAHLATDEEWQTALAEAHITWEQNREKVLSLGGLHITGTERHEARRIDNQLRGRSGRQGDPGSSRFYVSLEDDIMRRFGGDRIKSFMTWAGMEEDVPLEHKLVTKSIETAQTKVEAYNFDIRKHVVEYDDVMNKQREVIYTERDKILAGADLRSNVLEMVERELRSLVHTYLLDNHGEEWDVEGFVRAVQAILPLPPGLGQMQIEQSSRDEVEERLLEWARDLYSQREKQFGEPTCRLLERIIMLRAIDQHWIQHLTSMEEMRQGIGLRAIGQTDPLVAYKREGHAMFEALLVAIQENIVQTIFHVAPVAEAPPPPAPNGNGAAVAAATRPAPARAGAPRQTFTNRDAPVPATARVAAGSRSAQTLNASKVGRNDLCPCGSGRKYKRCHGR